MLVAGGTTLSAFWILVLNSWMHTPAGFEMIDGLAHATDWLAIIFNPSLPYRLTHMLLASGLTVAFLVAGIIGLPLAARRPRRRRDGQRCAPASTVAALLIPLQIVVGDLHGLNTLEHQPAKIAAMEGIWKTEKGAPLVLFALPDEAARRQPLRNRDPETGLAGTSRTRWTASSRAWISSPASTRRWRRCSSAFRIMVGIGLLMLAGQLGRLAGSCGPTAGGWNRRRG